MFGKMLISAAACTVLGIAGFAVTASADAAARGDVNGDKKINVSDIAGVAAHIKGLKALDADGAVQADVNFDGKVDVADIAMIASHIKGIKALPVDYSLDFKGYDAFLMFADGNMNWGNWNGTGYPNKPSFGIDADVTGSGTYTVKITKESLTGRDDTGTNPSLVYEYDEWADKNVLPDAHGYSILAVDITGIFDGTQDNSGNPIEGFLEDGPNPGIDKRVKGKYKVGKVNAELVSLKADGREVAVDKGKIRKGNLEEDNNCYRLELVNSMNDHAASPAIDADELRFYDELEVTFSIKFS